MIEPEFACLWGRVQTKLGDGRADADSSAIRKGRAAIQRRVWCVIHGCVNEGSVI
jgi:hypothetical protein